MKKNIALIAAGLMLVAVGCQSSHMERDNSETMNESAGAQSHSSDANQASSSRNVGQSGTVDQTTTNSLPQDSTGTTNNASAPK